MDTATTADRTDQGAVPPQEQQEAAGPAPMIEDATMDAGAQDATTIGRRATLLNDSFERCLSYALKPDAQVSARRPVGLAAAKTPCCVAFIIVLIVCIIYRWAGGYAVVARKRGQARMILF